MTVLTRSPATAPALVPLSMFDPAHVGMDELGRLVLVDFNDRPGMVIGGEPGAGKSSMVNLLTAHGALAHDCRLILIDGKLVELGPWRASADLFVGPKINDAIAAFETLQGVIDERCELLLDAGCRKVTKGMGVDAYLMVIDEFAFFSATVGTKAEREKFSTTTRDVVARGRACAVWVILATQRPSHTIVDPALRDLFGYRCAFRCTTDASSDIVLGHGWATKGYNAASIDPKARGVAWLLAEDGIPRRIKAAYLDDDQVATLARRASILRGQS
jgi:DNA segregation ATPase FtsK/SpoIIIE, S-DNA-T family